jgi:glycosyltransferase involved in cell wall biosynthesis
MPDVVVCTLAHGSSAELLEISRPSLRAYAAAHGHAYVEGAMPAGLGRPPAWAKVPLIRELLDAHELVLWLDADLVVVDPSRDVAAELAAGHVMAIAEHLIGGSHQPNSGVWLLRSAPETRRVLDWIWNAEEYVHHPWWENAALMDLLGYRLHPGAKVRDSWLFDHTTWLDKAFNSVPLDAAPRPVIKHYAGEPHERRLEAMRADAALLSAPAAAPRPVGAVRRAEDRPACVLRGDFGGAHSLSVVNDGLAGALERRGIEVTRVPRGATADPRPLPGISHGWPPAFGPASAGPAVAILPWEYGAPPQAWVDAIRRGLDRVWVPSTFVRDGYAAAGVPAELIDVVPNGIDPERFTPSGPALDTGADAACVFLFVGGSIWRKGIDILLDAWRRAFGPQDDVALVVKDFGTSSWYRGQGAGDRLREFAQDPIVAPIVYLDDELDAEAIPALYRAADVLVAPYRGEGFCLPVLEAMACGVAPIHTAAGPTGEFCPPGAGWALDSELVPLPSGSLAGIGPLAGEATVHEVDPGELAGVLRAAAGDAADRARRGSAARTAAQAWTWDAAAITAERSLERLAALPLSWLAREHPPAQLQTTSTAVAYAPDWSGDEWVRTLAEWSRAFGPDDPVTLVLQPPLADRARFAEMVQRRLGDAGVPAAALPDILVGEVEPRALHGVVAAADAVLLDATQHDAPSPRLTRRARRIIRCAPYDLEKLRRRLAA